MSFDEGAFVALARFVVCVDVRAVHVVHEPKRCLDEFLALVERCGGGFKLFLRAQRLGVDPILFALQKIER